METWRAELARVGALGVMITGVSFGCVSLSSYELAKSNAENAKLLYQNEQRRSQELAASNKQVKIRSDELEANLREVRTQLEHTDKEWRETRDELLRYKIDREQQRRKFRQGDTPLRLETERVAPEAETEARLKAQAQPQTGDPKRRLKELMQQLQTVLQEF